MNRLVGLAALATMWTLPALAADEPASSDGLTAQELAVEAPDSALRGLDFVRAEQTKEVVLEGVVEFGYQDEDGRYFVDLLERDKAYLGVRITTPEGKPVFGAMPDLNIEGSSRLLLSELTSAEDGVMNFGVIGGQMGLDTVTASIGDAQIEFAINVISLRAAGFPAPLEIEGGIPWDELLQARIEYKDMSLIATFPETIKQRAGETVKLSGFMMPLDPDLKQKHFLLTSNPPSCFFHIPGGPAGSVEVLAKEGIEMSWDPIVIEGRFEPQESSKMGVVYQLRDARVVDD